MHLSSTAVYGPKHKDLVTEDDLVRPFDAYNTAKIDGERLFERIPHNSSMRWTIIRPKAFVGPGRLGLFGQLYEFAYTGHNFPMIGRAENPYQFLHIDDLAASVMSILRRPDASNKQAFNIASDISGSISELFQAVLDEAGHGKRILHIPEVIAKNVLQFAHLLRLSPVYGRLIDNLISGSTVSIEKAKTRLGYLPSHSGQSALIDGYRWYAENRDLVKRDFGKRHTSMWKSPLASALKLFI